MKRAPRISCGIHHCSGVAFQSATYGRAGAYVQARKPRIPALRCRVFYGYAYKLSTVFNGSRDPLHRGRLIMRFGSHMLSATERLASAELAFRLKATVGRC